MGRGARLPFVELPRQSRLFRRTRIGARPCDQLVEVRQASPHAVYVHARRIGYKSWTRYRVSVFLESHTEVEHL